MGFNIKLDVTLMQDLNIKDQMLPIEAICHCRTQRRDFQLNRRRLLQEMTNSLSEVGTSETGWDLEPCAAMLQCLHLDTPLPEQQNAKKL